MCYKRADTQTVKMVGNLLAVHGIIFLQHLTFITSRDNKVVNLALHKPACQSSTYRTANSDGSAGLAVDGNSKNAHVDHSCSHTNLQFVSNAWWEVYLAKRYTIRGIKILNRATYAERLHDVRIDVYDSKLKPRGGRHCTTHIGPAGPGWLNVSCASSVTGRYVRITKPMVDKNDPLTLCEVEIYGSPEEKRSMIFKRDSKTSASVQGRMFTAISPVHCGFRCGDTPGCHGFNVIRGKDGRIRCNVVMECPDKAGKVETGNDTTAYHICW